LVSGTIWNTKHGGASSKIGWWGNILREVFGEQLVEGGYHSVSDGEGTT